MRAPPNGSGTEDYHVCIHVRPLISLFHAWGKEIVEVQNHHSGREEPTHQHVHVGRKAVTSKEALNPKVTSQLRRCPSGKKIVPVPVSIKFWTTNYISVESLINVLYEKDITLANVFF